MSTENIFLDVERWSQYSHPTKDLQHLQLKGTPEQIKNYFLHKAPHRSMLRRATSRQMEKIEDSLRSPKIKMIFKEKAKRLAFGRKR